MNVRKPQKKTNTKTEGGPVTYIPGATLTLTILFAQNCGAVKSLTRIHQHSIRKNPTVTKQ